DERKMCSIFRVIRIGRLSDRKLAPRACATNHLRVLSATGSSLRYQAEARNTGTSYSETRWCARDQTASRQEHVAPDHAAAGRICAVPNRDRLASASTPG